MLTTHFAGKARRRDGRRAAAVLLAVAAAGTVAGGVAAAPQLGPLDPAGSQAGSSSYALNAALGRLAANPNDGEALVAAGNAALALGDHQAAMGFLARANQLSPNNPRIKAAMAAAMLRGENPFEALRLFDEAERAGGSVAALAGDRGLAYDLVGANDQAQRQYRIALAAAGNDEIARRLAISLAIAGDRKQFDAVLAPQLQRQVLAGWRARALGLAILGAEREAVGVVTTMMPPALAQGLAPYLRYMPRLTPAQQAAAANFGQFPRVADIGRDDPRVLAYAALHPRRPRPGEAGPIARGQPPAARAGSASKRARESVRWTERQGGSATAGGARLAVQTPPPRAAWPAAPVPSRPPAAAAQPIAAPPPPIVPPPAAPLVLLPPGGAPVARFSPSAAAPPVPAAGGGSVTPAPATLPAGVPLSPVPGPPPPAGLVGPPVPSESGPFAGPSAPPAAPPPVPGPAGVPGPAAAGVVPAPAGAMAAVTARLAPPPFAPSVASAPPAAPTPEPAPAPPIEPAQPPGPGLAAAFSDFRVPAAESSSAAAPALAPPPAAAPQPVFRAPPVATAARLNPVRPGRAAPAPSRIFVQLGTGEDLDALVFDWRRVSRRAPEVLARRKPLVTAFGQSNRLLVGPFAGAGEAQAVVNQLEAKDVRALVWTSRAGQAVELLPP